MWNLHAVNPVESYMGAWIEIPVVARLLMELIVASYMGAWIEISFCLIFTPSTITSHPIWVRGLKYLSQPPIPMHSLSHPIWVRGLKYLPNFPFYHILQVASYMGAWIEIISSSSHKFQSNRRILYGCVD